MLNDDLLVRRRLGAVQLGLAAAVPLMLLSPEALDLTRTMTGQLPVVLLAVTVALLVEGATRPGPAPAGAPAVQRARRVRAAAATPPRGAARPRPTVRPYRARGRRR